jgi:hypothetical protein
MNYSPLHPYRGVAGCKIKSIAVVIINLKQDIAWHYFLSLYSSALIASSAVMTG